MRHKVCAAHNVKPIWSINRDAVPSLWVFRSTHADNGSLARLETNDRIRDEKTIAVRRAGRFGQRPGIDHLPRRDVRRPPIANLPKVVAVALDRLVRTERHLIVGRRLFGNRNDPGRQTVWPEDEMARPEIAMRPVPERRRNWRRVRTQFHRRGRLIYLQPRYLATGDGLQVL